MAVVVGLCIAFAGAVAALAGLTARRKADRLREHGISAWAMVVRAPDASGDGGARSHRLLLQYALADGRVIERLCPAAGRKAAALIPGQKVLVWYDPADPGEVIVNGRDGRYSDWAFAIVGIAFVLAGAGIARFGH